jgi:hypothetical protein
VSAGARIPLKVVFDMLDACAPGHSRPEKLHHYWVSFNGKTFNALPTGERGTRRPEVFIGKVRAMARHLGILECARRHIPGL